MIAEQPELFKGRDFGVRGALDKLPGGGEYYDRFVAPEVGGYQMPGVARSIAPTAAAVMYQQALQRGAGPGSVMGGVGGLAGGAGFGALAGQQVVRSAQAKAKEEEEARLKSARDRAEKEGRPAPQRPKTSMVKGLGGLAGRAAAQLGAAAIGSGLGGAIGSVVGGAEGFLGGRSSGAGILGGGVAGGGVAGLAAAVGSMIPATGKGSFAWPSLALATASGFLGSEVMSSIVKNVESTRKRLALGGADGSIFPQGPIAQRVG